MINYSQKLFNTNVPDYFLKEKLTTLLMYLKSISFKRCLFLGTSCFLLISCSTTQPPVPIVDRVIYDSADTANKLTAKEGQSSQSYIVQKGDTLSGIALNHGIDARKLAEWNHITDPNSIKPGQVITLSLPVQQQDQPVLFSVMPEQSPLSTTIEAAPAPVEVLPQIATHEEISDKVKTNPKAIKLPFSEQNLAQLQQQSADSSPAVRVLPNSASGFEKNARIENAPQPILQKQDEVLTHSDAEWMWPTTGKLLSSFSKDSKGVKISGQAGQTIVASAGGEVVYSGHGLRGYGNLIIIKHNNTFLSAYAHNSKILVKEGETVAKGQKIAEMGNTDTNTVQLHFEIRKHGKPVDPLEYLPKQS